MGLATALQERRDRKRQEELDEARQEGRKEERDRVIAFYKKRAEESGEEFVEPPEEPSPEEPAANHRF